MSKTLKIYIAVIVGIVLLLVFFNSAKVKPVNWAKSYSLDTKNPFDLYIFNQEISNFISEKRLERIIETPYEYLQEERDKSIYLMIKQNMYNFSDSVILDEVKKGSILMVSSENFFRNFTDSLHVTYSDIDPNSSLLKKDQMKLSLTAKGTEKSAFYLRKVENSFSFVEMDSSITTILGECELPDKFKIPNFICIRYGKGLVYLHNQPQVFTNYALLKNENCDRYVAGMLSYLPDNLPVVWFVDGQTVHADKPVNETVLSVVFRYPALEAVWLLFLYGMLLYLIFNAKRRQRVVPVVKPLKNTTVEFVQTIGNLYYQEGEISSIYSKMIVFFLDKVRQRYFIDTSVTDDKFVQKLHLKSGKDKKLIKTITGHINFYRTTGKVNHEDVLNMNSMIAEFWNEK